MSARSDFEQGLDLGWENEREGIYEPAASAGPPGTPLTHGVRRGREARKRERDAALVVDRPSTNPWNEELAAGRGDLCA